MTAPVFVDTNVLVYHRDSTEPAKQARAGEWLAFLWQQRLGRISTQVLQEFYAVVTRKLSPCMPEKEARRELRLFDAWQPVVSDLRLFEAAWEVEDRFGLSWWDALIVAAARQAGCSKLLTEGLQAGQVLFDVEVVDPFESSPED
jgi:predicted nucleic acid-binding protein